MNQSATGVQLGLMLTLCYQNCWVFKSRSWEPRTKESVVESFGSDLDPGLGESLETFIGSCTVSDQNSQGS